MKKKLFLCVISGAIMFSLIGCGNTDSGELQSIVAQPQAIESSQTSAKENAQASTSEKTETQNTEVQSTASSQTSTEKNGKTTTSETTASVASTSTSKQESGNSENTIVLEGMEETVKYEHIKNENIGIELDYDGESLARRSESNRECFISIYDDIDNPENYLEVTYDTKDADIVAVSVSEALSKNYDITKESVMLDKAGSCTQIDATKTKGNSGTNLLQMVYIIPTTDGGSIVATAHYSVESAEGFGRRFSYIMDTLVVINKNSESKSEKKISDEQALSAIQKYCYANNPDLESIVKAGEYQVYWDISSSDEKEIVVLFRSYTGAQIRYYIDRTSGEVYVTEFVPGIHSEEERTDESFNVKDYL